MGLGPDFDIRWVLASSRKGAELGAGTPVVGACAVMGEGWTLYRTHILATKAREGTGSDMGKTWIQASF